MKSLAHQHGTPVLAFALEGAQEALDARGVDLAHFERALLAPARDFLMRPGKAFRARLIESCFVLAGGPKGQVPRACLEAIELLHGGSLIVDDIEDQAEMRRGAPALHRLVGTPRALNIGNWLYFVALSKLHELDLDAPRVLALTRAAHGCLVRCHEGQALDLGVRLSELKGHELAGMALATSTLKTGALMAFAARLGAEVASASEADGAALEEFGERMGVALQMLDDLGSFSAPERRAKALEDLAGERVSWVWSWARETLDEVSFRQLVRALGRPEEHDELCDRLSAASHELGRARVHGAIDRAVAGVRTAFPASAAREQLIGDLTRLEKSYG